MTQPRGSKIVQFSQNVNIDSPGKETRPIIKAEMVSSDPSPTNSSNSQGAQAQASNTQSDNEGSDA